MIYKSLLAIFSILTLASCQNQTITVKNNTPAESSTNSTPVSPAPSKTSEPELSVGLPPDPAVVVLSKQEQATAAKSTVGVIYLKEGENKFLKEYGMNVTFKKMTEDSRCPQGVNCVWAGVAVAEIELMGLHTRPVTVRLSTMNDANKSYVNSQDFNGHSVSLVEVRPNTTSDKGFKCLVGNYRIGLKITNGSLGSSTVEHTTTK